LLMKANSLVMQLRFDEAVPFYHRLLERDPTKVQAMINLGNICRANDDIEQATRWFDRAEVIDADFRDLIFARATMHTQLGEDDQSIKLLEPIASDVDAQFLLSLLYLAQGDYERGFRLYRDRTKAIWAKQWQFPQIGATFDHWREATDKTIAIIPEGGLGDLIQFVRYVPQLAEVARSITMFIPQTLIRLFLQLPDNVILKPIEDDYDPAEFDYSTSTVEMPYHFRTTLDTIPNTIPYLAVSEDMIAQRRLPIRFTKTPQQAAAKPAKLRVGLCWAGGARGDLNRRSYDHRRSFDLALYAPLGRVPGIEFVSLQMGQRADQVRVDLPMTRVLEPSFDMLDTAAIIAQLDLVITVDTAIAHLAAAIGKPTWILSRYDSCWRWLHNRPDSPWYPGVVRVFGQKRYNDWSEPLTAVRQALKDFEEGKRL
jgi:tetratricopeptide (TPR) repeat protein